MCTTGDGVFGRCGLHNGLLAGVAATAPLSSLVSAHAEASKPTGSSNSPTPVGAAQASSIALDEISVEGQQPTFGTTGFVATRSTAGMKERPNKMIDAFTDL